MEKDEFYENVYKIVARIPRGKVMTYGLIGFMLGSRYFARRVGRAMAKAHGRELPCHRVINSKGEMAPSHVFGGRRNQYQILKEEGVFFKPNGCVDLKKSLWRDWDVI